MEMGRVELPSKLIRLLSDPCSVRDYIETVSSLSGGVLIVEPD